MSDVATGGFGILGLVILLFLLVLAILWFLLPFAIFGTKDKLNTLIEEARRTNAELSRIAEELSAAKAELAQQKRYSINARDD